MLTDDEGPVRLDIVQMLGDQRRADAEEGG
jgi:hypothetical protein